MRRKKMDREKVAKNKIRKALVLLGTSTIMGAASCGVKTAEVGAVEAIPARMAHNSEAATGSVEEMEASADEVMEAGTRVLERMRESEVFLRVSEDGTRLRAEVLVYEPGERAGFDIAEIMEEVTATCQSSPNVLLCIGNETIERTNQVRGTTLPNAQVEFRYFSGVTGDWESLDGIARGNQCDISNIVPGIIRAVFVPEEGSNVRTSSAVYRIPRSLDSD